MKPTVKMLFDCETVYDVVALLRKFEIKCSKNKKFTNLYQSCPISSYMRKSTHKKVGSWPSFIKVGVKEFTTPGPVSLFILGFDLGAYPEFK